jgi:hypothetical protein
MSAPSRPRVAITSLDESTLQAVRPLCLPLRMRIQDIVRLIRLLEETRATLRPQVEPVDHRAARDMTWLDDRAGEDVNVAIDRSLRSSLFP